MDSRRSFQRRSRVLLAGMLVGLGLVAGRSFQLQVLQHDELGRLARGQYLDDVKVPAWRGHIYDRNGKTIAVSVEVPSVYANPLSIADPRQAARQLAKILELDLDTVYQRLASERYFVWLKRQVTPEVAGEIEALKLAGVGITKEPRRFYPNVDVGAHVIGFAGLDAKGLEGIELALDEHLAGEPQVVAAVRDARGRAVLEGSLDADRTRGADVRLTVDLQIQHAAQKALRDALQEFQAESGLAVVLDVDTAEVLAMAVEPPFNPNKAKATPAARRRNRAITDVFEPGSTMKPLVVAAAIDGRFVDKKAAVFCENGSLRIGTHTIRDGKPYGWMGLTAILQKSSNIGAAKIGQAMGRDALAAALRRYGFGERSGIELPGEVGGMLRAASTWSNVGVATISYGHGIAVNAVQLAAAYRVLAAGGMYRAPRIVRSVRYADGREVALAPPAERRVLETETTRALRPMLEAVVTPEGTGLRAAVPGYRVAGKTGTAQKIDPVDGGYSNDRFVSVFGGYLPADAPKVVIAVAIDEPKKKHTGGEVAAPVFSRIGAAAMQVLGIVPSPALARELLEDEAPKGAPEPVAPPPEPATIATGAAAAPGTVPSFLGLTARQVIDRYGDMRLPLELELTGSGRVVEQHPAPGTSNDRAQRVRLVLASQ